MHSEHQFHTLLAHVKQYAMCRATRADEHHALLHAGYPGNGRKVTPIITAFGDLIGIVLLTMHILKGQRKQQW
jgi:hypothetical protein